MAGRQHYHILIEGSLGEKWSGWFGGLAIVPQDENRTLLCGELADQTALHGVLIKLRDLGIPIIEIKRIDDNSESLEGEG